jgi:hypothetical protein
LIELSSDSATLVAGSSVVAAAGWASYVSVRSAALGPGWAVGHMARARFVVLVLVAIGLVVALLARPVWVGVVVVYVPLAILVLMWMVRRALVRLDGVGGFEPLDGVVGDRVLDRARSAMVVGAGVLVGLGGLGLTAGIGPVAWVMAAVGAVMALNGLLIGGVARSTSRRAGG